MDGVIRKQGRERNGKITSKKNPLPKQRIIYGRGGETRTRDTRFWRPVLYQLSYSRVCGCKGSVIFGIYKPIYEKILFIIRLIGLTH